MERLTPSERKVLLYLVGAAREGAVHASITEMVEATGLSYVSVGKALRSLERAGWITLGAAGEPLVRLQPKLHQEAGHLAEDAHRLHVREALRRAMRDLEALAELLLHLEEEPPPAAGRVQSRIRTPDGRYEVVTVVVPAVEETPDGSGGAGPSEGTDTGSIPDRCQEPPVPTPEP